MLTPQERRAAGYEELPASLGDAVSVLEGSELVADALGEHVFDYFLRNKRRRMGCLPRQGHAPRAAHVAEPVKPGVPGDAGCEHGAMQVRTYHDPVAYRALVTPLLAADPVRHTVLLTALAALCRAPSDDAVLLGLHRGGELVGGGAADPRPTGCPARRVPGWAVGEFTAALTRLDPELPGFTGPVEVVDALVAASGRVVVESTPMRLFALQALVAPAGCGRHGAADGRGRRRTGRRPHGGVSPPRPVLRRTRWRRSRSGGAAARPSCCGSTAARWCRWRCPPHRWAGMSRVGPVHTPHEFRGNGVCGRRHCRRDEGRTRGRRAGRGAVHRPDQPGDQPAVPETGLRGGRRPPRGPIRKSALMLAHC